MRKRTLLSTLAAAVLAAPLAVSADDTSTSVILCAGQHNNVGLVNVWQDERHLVVEFDVTVANWYLQETHVAVASDPKDLPQTASGNPIPGQFPYSCVLPAGTLNTSCEVRVPLAKCHSNDLYIAAHAVVAEIEGDGCGNTMFYADEVVDSWQGPCNDTNPVRPERSSPFYALDPYDGMFYSLGMGGWLTVSFPETVFNGPGVDVCAQEMTWHRSTYPCEHIEIFGEMTGGQEFCGAIENHTAGIGRGCVELPDHVATLEMVTIKDTTVPGEHIWKADGYDVEWIAACYQYLGDETAWGAACGDELGIPFWGHRWATYFPYSLDLDDR